MPKSAQSGMKVGLDQAVGGEAADQEGDEEDPEGAGLRGVGEGGEGVAHGIAGRRRRGAGAMAVAVSP
jgi:hypothetical protein